MSRIEKISKLLKAMAFSRQVFNDKLRHILTGAFGEFMKRQIALAINEPDRANDWTVETRTLLSKVKHLMGDSVKVTFKKKEKVLLISFKEAVSYLEVVQAKNTLQGYLPKKIWEIHNLKFDEHEEFGKMIQEFLPEYAALLEEEKEK